MKKTIYIFATFVLFLALSLTGKAQENQSDSIKLPDALLWKIEKPEMPAPSYIFGTIHIIPEDDFFFTDSMYAAFDRSEQLMLEVDINIPILKQLAIAKDIYLPKRRTLADYMNEADYKNYRTALIDSLKISEFTVNMADRMKPIFASGLFINELLENPVQYEKFLNDRAADKKMPAKGLETIDFQMETVNSIPPEEQIKILTGNEGLAAMEHEYRQLIETYKKQDITALAALIEDDSFSAEAEQQLLGNRNNTWVPIIETEILNTPSFIAVGAGHLAGKQGIIKLLKKRGFTITPVH